MKRFTSKEFEDDCRICGSFNDSPLAIARAVTSELHSLEKLHYHKSGFEYYIFFKGKVLMVIGGEEFSFGAGDVVLIEPGEKHKVVDFLEETDYMTIRTNNDSSDKIVCE